LKFLNSVEHVSIEYIGEQNLRAVSTVIRNQSNMKLPADFYINGNWRLKHACTRCGELVTTGADEPIMGNQPNFKRLPYLKEKYFNKNVLKNFAAILSKVVLVKLDGEYKVLKEDYDISFALPIEIFYYKCENCQTNYIANYLRGYGSDTERGEEPTLDKIWIKQIVNVQIESADDIAVLKFENENKL
jgi:hypothetical protein